MRVVGPAGMFLFIGAILGTTALFIVLRMLARPAPRPAEQGDFVPMPPPEGTPSKVELDPRADGEQATVESLAAEPVLLAANPLPETPPRG